MKKKKNNSFIIKSIVGATVTVLLAAYFVFSLVSYLGKQTVKFYEVTEGSLAKEHNFTGLIVREEKVIESEGNGYISFYVPDSRKVSRNQKVYLLDSTGNLKSYLEKNADRLGNLNRSKLQQITSGLRKASSEYSDINFRKSYDIKDSLDAMVLELTDIDTLNSILDDLKSSGISYTDYSTPETGLVSYHIDGYEDITTDNITVTLFDRTGYSSKRLKSGDMVEQGEPVYKLINSEKWYIVFEETEEIRNELSSKTKLQIRLQDKDITLTVPYTSIMSVDGNVYGLLTLDRYLIQYVSDRFIDFEIITNDVSGLKIPEKAILTKDFYVIPEDFLSTDENGNAGFYKAQMTENGTSCSFIVTDIYMTEEGMCYVDLSGREELKEGDIVVKPETVDGDPYQIKEKRPLEGVYNINKGYTVFRRIERIESANGYCVVKKNTGHGLAVFDHIILDASTVSEGQVLYK